jgi:hypothetical protein
VLFESKEERWRIEHVVSIPRYKVTETEPSAFVKEPMLKQPYTCISNNVSICSR